MLLKRIPLTSIAARRYAKGDAPLHENLMNVPTGKSDVGFSTRLTYLSKEVTDSYVGIRGMSAIGFRLYDFNFLWGPIAVFPTVAVSWKVCRPEDINEESLGLFFALRPKLDVLVLGVGARKNLDIVRRNVAKLSSKYRVGIELLVSEEAVTTFNYLNEERRYVAGAFFPQEDLKVSEEENVQSLAMHQSRDHLPGNPLFSTLCNPFNEPQGILNRMYGENDKSREAMEMVTKIREMDMEIKRAKRLERYQREEEQLRRPMITRGEDGKFIIGDNNPRQTNRLRESREDEVTRRLLEGDSGDKKKKDE
ncbi:unnamed protein product [Bursaphelenchus okinawaensis]|uniref:NADH dehydrogenase [ubiquinone] 1 alpha subcomplex assembly factor 3 n=1 Tax=Bursaphelenchus okinawaensis TaxID=465554 RepID=A0A811KU87_9BILA|nr:unnamed protein product [Bursaphelenchus okinawaensis]CAG9111839.1 unnamed protein product [Bursaphelenchus okinawaensis]